MKSVILSVAVLFATIASSQAEPVLKHIGERGINVGGSNSVGSNQQMADNTNQNSNNSGTGAGSLNQNMVGCANCPPQQTITITRSCYPQPTVTVTKSFVSTYTPPPQVITVTKTVASPCPTPPTYPTKPACPRSYCPPCPRPNNNVGNGILNLGNGGRDGSLIRIFS
ncbi:uncharacterized protein VTP21DRAFT_10801 [Calcarisporiella thermophila]|uniref:uncharacterized protein n=1 Tax=Calcarisporiella thermophila TaxID=911321 RepID=UPI003743BE77